MLQLWPSHFTTSLLVCSFLACNNACVHVDVRRTWKLCVEHDSYFFVLPQNNLHLSVVYLKLQLTHYSNSQTNRKSHWIIWMHLIQTSSPVTVEPHLYVLKKKKERKNAGGNLLASRIYDPKTLKNLALKRSWYLHNEKCGMNWSSTELVGPEQPEKHLVIFCGFGKLTFVLLEFGLREQLFRTECFGFWQKFWCTHLAVRMVVAQGKRGRASSWWRDLVEGLWMEAKTKSSS